jgi:glutathione synthase
MKLGVVMDPIQAIDPQHDSTLALLLEAAVRGWSIFYLEGQDLFLRDGKAYGAARLLKVFDRPQAWFSFEESCTVPLDALDLILMRKDPPFNEEYLYLTQILACSKTRVVNNPQALREVNEKLAIAAFPDCCVPTQVSSKIAVLNAFWQAEKDIVCKPLDAMGGRNIFRLQPHDPNGLVIFETLTRQQTRHIMVQRFIPQIVEGDKRILLINGEPLPFAVARIPQPGEWRGNMALGAKPVAQPLSKRDAWICERLGPFLREKGIYFAGIDVIGDYLTEINITSPTGIRELDAQCKINVSAQLLDCLERLHS